MTGEFDVNDDMRVIALERLSARPRTQLRPPRNCGRC